MATIQRPGKEGNATTYQGKVAAGYTNILAQEVDADIDAIYSAWNAGVDTVNIKDGAVTGPKLAPGAVTGTALAPGSIATAALADSSVTTPKLADNSVTSAKIANGAITDVDIASVGWTKLVAPYLGQITLTPRAVISIGSAFGDIDFNTQSSPNYDSTKPSWIVRTDYTGDAFTILRAPPNTTAFVQLFYVDGAGNLKPGSIGRSQLAVNAPNSVLVATPAPGSFILSTAGVWTTVATLPSLTTRGGNVHLIANHTLSVSGPVGGSICNQRWRRDGSQIAAWSFNIGSALVPFPGLHFIDQPAAGAHVYDYQVIIGANCTMVASNQADGVFEAVEIG